MSVPMRTNLETGEEQPVRFEIVNGVRKQMHYTKERARDIEAEQAKAERAAAIAAAEARKIKRSEINDANSIVKLKTIMLKAFDQGNIIIQEDV